MHDVIMFIAGCSQKYDMTPAAPELCTRGA